MRFFEFKNVSKKNKLVEQEDEKLPSSSMTNANLLKNDRKYVKTIGASIAQNRTFTFRTKKTTPVPAEYQNSVFRGVIVNGEELLGQLEVSKKPASVTAKVNVKGGGVIDVPVGTMVKDAVATGEVRFNLGNVAEAVMGSAVAAKFAKGGGNVSRQDALAVSRIVAVNEKYTTTTPSKDNLEFAVTVPVADSKVFNTFVTEGKEGLEELEIDAAKIRKISKMFDDAVAFVNESKSMKAAVDKAQADPRENRIEVLSDGGNAEKQNTTKVDLEVMLDGEKINLISLKTGTVKQFGQESGAGYETLDRFFKSTIGFGLPDNMAQKFKGPREPDYKEFNFKGPFAEAYQHVFKEIKSQVAGDNERQEYDLVKAVYDGIKYHATRNEEGVILVVLSPSAKKAYQELQFGEPLLEALRGYDLDATLESGANHKITIIGRATTKEAASVDKADKLVQFRSYAQGAAVRNIVEMEGLLKDLADLQKLQAKTDAKPKPKAQVEPQSQPEQQPPETGDKDERSF